MTMHNPPHPGETLRHLYLEPLGMTVGELAKHLGVSRKTLSLILNGKARITPDMAIRLSKAFNTTPETWLKKQMQHDLWRANLQADSINVEPAEPA